MNPLAADYDDERAFSLGESDYDEDEAREDYGYYDGDTKYVIRTYHSRVKLPTRSNRIPGAWNIYSPTSFTIGAKESYLLRTELGIVVPDMCTAKFTSREALNRCTGVVVVESAFGPG